MNDFTFLNFLIGPLGQSFGFISDKGHLFTENSFEELPAEAVQKYNRLSCKNENRLFSIGYSEEDNTVEIVNELEKFSLIQASELIKKMVGEAVEDIADEKKLLEYFGAKFNFLTVYKPEPKIYYERNGHNGSKREQ